MDDQLSIQLGDIKNTLEAFSRAVEPGFGPSFQQTLMTTSSGKILITNSGSDIVNAINAPHLIRQYIIKCIKDHRSATGDGSKEFVILLNSLLCECLKVADDTRSLHQMSMDIGHCLRDDLPTIMTELEAQCIKFDIADPVQLKKGVESLSQGLLESYLLQHDSALLPELFGKFITSWMKNDLLRVIEVLINDSDILLRELPNRPMSCSYIQSGLLISRGFANSDVRSLSTETSCTTIKFLMLSRQLVNTGNDTDVTYKILNSGQWRDQIDLVITHRRLRADVFLQRLRDHGVSLILTSSQFSSLELTQSLRHGITVVHTVPEPELLFLSHQIGGTILDQTDDFTLASIASATVCKRLLIGTQVYTNIHSERLVGACTMVIAGATEGTSYQSRCRIVDCMKALRQAATDGTCFSHSR